MPPPFKLTIDLPQEEYDETTAVDYKVHNIDDDTRETITKKAKADKEITTEDIIRNFNHIKNEFFQFENMSDPLIQNLKRGMETTFADLISRLDDKENQPSIIQEKELKFNAYTSNHEIHIKAEEGEFNALSLIKKVFNANSLAVSVIKSGNMIVKKILFDLADPNILFKLILEVHMQILGLQIATNKSIDIIIPKIKSVSLYERPEKRARKGAVFEFSMDYIPIIDVDMKKNKQEIMKNCAFWIGKINSIFQMFEDNGLFHNDSHRDNLCFTLLPNGKLKLVLLDFGIATLHKFGNQSTTSFYKEITCPEKFEKWLSGTRLNMNDIYSILYFYGGKTKRKRKRGRKSLRRKRV